MRFIDSKQAEDEKFSDFLPDEGDEPPKSTKIKRNSAPPTALSVALRLVSMRDHSSRQLREKLLQRGFSATETEETLALLREKRLIDDLRLGRNLIRYMAERRYFGAYKIRMELSQKLDREHVDALLPDELDAYDFRALACEFVGKSQNRGKSREQMIRLLRARGYGAQEIRFAVNAREYQAEEI